MSFSSRAEERLRFPELTKEITTPSVAAETMAGLTGDPSTPAHYQPPPHRPLFNPLTVLCVLVCVAKDAQKLLKKHNVDKKKIIKGGLQQGSKFKSIADPPRTLSHLLPGVFLVVLCKTRRRAAGPNAALVSIMQQTSAAERPSEDSTPHLYLLKSPETQQVTLFFGFSADFHCK